jgi:hypothetical protein
MVADNANTSQTPSAHPGYQPATSSSHTLDIAAASTNPDAGRNKFKEWDWAYEEGETNWCTVKLVKKASSTITVLLRSNRQSGISIFLALPEPFEETERNWEEDAKLSQVTKAVKKIMDTINFPACLQELQDWQDSARNFKRIEADAEVEEFLMQTANSLIRKAKLNKLSVGGNGLPCDVTSYDIVFRQAKEWDDISPGRHYADFKTLIRDSPYRGYALASAQVDRYFRLIRSLGGSRVEEVEE